MSGTSRLVQLLNEEALCLRWWQKYWESGQVSSGFGSGHCGRVRIAMVGGDMLYYVTKGSTTLRALPIEAGE